MDRIDVRDRSVDGAWLIQEAEKLGVSIPARSARAVDHFPAPEPMAGIVEEIAHFSDPLTPSPLPSHRTQAGKAIIFVKKALRKFLRPLFAALINTQGIFNSKVLEWVRIQQRWNQDMEHRLAELEKMVMELTRRVRESGSAGNPSLSDAALTLEAGEKKTPAGDDASQALKREVEP